MENLNEKQLLFGPFYCFCASKLDFLFFPLFSSRVAVKVAIGCSGCYDLDFISQTDRYESSVLTVKSNTVSLTTIAKSSVPTIKSNRIVTLKSTPVVHIKKYC